MVRLKYHTLAKDNLLYTDWFTVGPNYVIRAIINTETLTYQIYEFNSEIVIEGQCSSLRQAKDTVKKKLIGAGVVFGDEIRIRQ